MRITKSMASRARALCAAIAMASMGCGAVAQPEPVAIAPVDRGAANRAIARALDDMHDAAAHADEARYFAHFASDGVFLGTDATERWELPAFRAFARPHFAKGKAWAFHAIRRAIVLSADGTLAWFDEDLATEKLGPARGSGVLALIAGEWKVEQYNLTTVVPNERFAAVRAAIDKPDVPPAIPFDERYAAARARAVADAKRGDFKEAEHELRALVAEAEAGEIRFEAIGLRYELAWLRWSDGDLAGAWAELDAQKSARRRFGVMGNMSGAMRVNEERDRAFLLREMAEAAPPTLRPQALAAANAARAEHEKDGGALGDQRGIAVLAALFAVRAGDARGALAAAKRVNVAEEKDPLDLYVVALAFDLGRDRARADEIRAAIRGVPDDVMKLVVIRKMGVNSSP